MLRRLLVCAFVVSVAVTSACREAPDGLGPISARGGITPMCQLGCVEEDSFPMKPGVFLGSGVTPDNCLWGTYTDADQDNLGDFCEKQVAAAFAPELAYGSGDNVSGEPRWAARIVGDDVIRIAYLFSYYVDLGTDPAVHWPCSVAWGEAACSGHYGDAETVVLDVSYDSQYKHWVLRNAWYSQHHSFEHFATGPKGYPSALYYPSRAGAHPRTYVAYGKHANYASQFSCENGQFGFDDCLPDTYVRIQAAGNANVGSSSVHLIDCVPSANPLYAQNGNECYWSPQDFGGWQGGAQPDSDTRYLHHLTAFGF